MHYKKHFKKPNLTSMVLKMKGGPFYRVESFWTDVKKIQYFI